LSIRIKMFNLRTNLNSLFRALLSPLLLRLAPNYQSSRMKSNSWRRKKRKYAEVRSKSPSQLFLPSL
jgi:hypothetical protein